MIRSLDASQATRALESLADLLIDAVDGGASIGFIPPLEREEATAYWRTVMDSIAGGTRVLLVSEEDGPGLIQGSVQLSLETRANGDHRAEVAKLFVHRRARRRGVATALMGKAEATARQLGRTLLLADTRKGGEAERLCEKLGWTRFGEVPRYARSSNGELDPTVFYYKQLD